MASPVLLVVFSIRRPLPDTSITRSVTIEQNITNRERMIRINLEEISAKMAQRTRAVSSRSRGSSKRFQNGSTVKSNGWRSEQSHGCCLRDIIAEYKTPVSWEALAGIAAIDAHNALYQFLSIIRQPDGTPLMDQRGRVTSHLSGILFRTSNFIEKGIRPVYVFDGTPPAFKQATIESRRMVTGTGPCPVGGSIGEG